MERLSFISPHPKDFSEKIVADLAAVPQLNPRLHMPMQSASDAVLRRMNRKYTATLFHEKVEFVRRYLPQWAITTDLIAGFPGESDDDFERTLDYVRSGVFANAFTFMYSIRRGTPAAHWEQVPRDMASARFARLLDAQNAVTRAYHDAKIGGVVRALVTGPSKKDDRKLAARALDNVTIDRADAGRLRRNALRARAVARRRDRNRARMGMHRDDRAARGVLRGSGSAVERRAVSLL